VPGNINRRKDVKNPFIVLDELQALALKPRRIILR